MCAYACACVSVRPCEYGSLDLAIISKPRTPKLLPFPSKATRLPMPASGGASGRSTITATEMEGGYGSDHIAMSKLVFRFVITLHIKSSITTIYVHIVITYTMLVG